jgi:23S rRNA (guanosine2251-2'-O)-methyltransferase
MDDKQRRKGRAPARHLDPYSGKDRPELDAEETRDVIEGRNAVLEALKAGRAIDKVYIAKGDRDASLGHIAALARDAGAVVADADRRKLDAISRSGAHQGVVALAAVKAYVGLEDILEIAKNRGEAPLIVVCDEISDVHNMGAIIRTAECAGAHGVVLPKRRSAGMTAVVAKTSAGAVELLAVSRVANIASALETLKKAGVWIYGAASDGDSALWGTDLTGPAAVVIGSEGEGLGRLVREKCDFMVRIPMVGKISSLNASVSASIVLYEAFRQRTGKGF